MRFFWIFLGGGIGAVLRIALGAWLAARAPAGFPWGTFAVNALGCFSIGFVASVALARGMLGSAAHLFLAAGLLGGFTTFSAFGLETLHLLQAGSRGTALLYSLGSMGLGVLAVGIGDWIGRASS